MSAHRQLSAIMYTDIVGFSSMMHSDPTLADQIRQRQLSIFKEAHDRFRGKIVQRFGDSTLSIFSSAAEAVECAYQLQVECRRSPEIPVRVGIHTGEIIQDEGGAYGEGISIASRIERFADPGSIYITAKVYDDIKNHAWLSATTMGLYKLDDLHQELEIYAVTNRGLHIPSPRKAYQQTPSRHRHTANESNTDLAHDHYDEDVHTSKKRKHVAAILALTLGLTGVHRIYLGQRFKGILFAIASFVALMITIEKGVPAIAVMAMFALVEAVLFFVMPESDFDLKYNPELAGKTQTPKKKKGFRNLLKTKKSKNPVFGKLKDAMRKYEAGKYDQAVSKFDLVLNADPENTVAHYYLACCFSQLRDTEDAFYHLQQAITYGFDDFDRIERDRALRNIRSLEQFKTYRDQGYRDLAALPAPAAPDLLNNERLELSTLEKIELLGDQLERGELSMQEFQQEKQKILSS